MLGASERTLAMLFTLTTLFGTIDQSRVHLIDAYPRGTGAHNFIFRGNNPTTTVNGTTVFDYDTLVSSMRLAANKECNVTLPSTFRIVDVDLENLSDPGYFVEHQYWKKNPDKGEVLQWTTLGSALDVKVTPNRDSWVKNGTWAIQGKADQLPERLATLHAALLNATDPPTVFFVHCNAGCDRTGEFIGAYAMSYLKYNITTAMGEASKQCGRTPNFFASESLGWWCLTLTAQGRTDMGNCLDAFGVRAAPDPSTCGSSPPLTASLTLVGRVSRPQCKYLGDCDTHGATPLADACPRA